MADLDLSVVLRIAAEGGAKTQAEVSSLQGAVDELGRSGAISEKDVQRLTSSLGALGKVSSKTTSQMSTERASKGYHNLSTAIDQVVKSGGNLSRVAAQTKQLTSETERLANAQRAGFGSTAGGDVTGRGNRQSELAQLRGAIQARNEERIASEKTAAKVEQDAARKAEAEARAAEQVAADWAEAGRRLEAVQKKRAEEEAKESNRQMDARQKAASEAERAAEREKAALEKKAAADHKAAESARKKAAADQKARQEADKSTESINAQRYALYEVAAVYGTVSAGITALGTKTVRSFADMESGFSKVERTSGLYGDALKPLEEDLLGLSRTIPTVTSEIQDLAARGAQMGIAVDSIESFTETMAKFIATSPEVDVNSVAEAFGRISNLTGEDDFQAIASAIAQVGVNSAATDAQIIKTAEGMARASAAFGFTADEIVGLSAAFASLGVQPEAARGIMNQFVVTVERGAAGISDSMEVMARSMGVSTEAATQLWKTDPTQFLTSLVEAVSKSGNLVTTLDEMGVTGQRITPLFAALTKDFSDNAQGASVLAQALADSNEGFRERTELDKQYQPIMDDLNSKFTILKNGVLELAYAFGGELSPVLKGAFDALLAVVHGITDFVNTPVGGFIAKVVGGLATVVAVYTGLRAIIALSSASMIAFTTAMGGATGAARGLGASLRHLIGSIFGTGKASAGAAGGVRTLSASLRALGRATVVIALVSLVIEILSDVPAAAVHAGKALVWFGNLVDQIAAKLGIFAGLIPVLNSNLGKLGVGNLQSVGAAMQEWGEANRKTEGSVEDLAGTIGDFNDGLGALEEGAYDAGDALGGGGGGGSDSLAGGAEKAEEKVRTLLDYASDLASIMSRAFEIRFSGATAADNITKVFNDLRKAAQESAERIKALRGEIRTLLADIQGLESDISQQEYFLKIALEYGDTNRAEAIQANIAKLQADLANKQDDLAKAQKGVTEEQDKNSKSLKGNTEQAIANRDTMRGLVQSYQAQIEALASSGMSQDKLRKKTAQLRADFIKQATQLGFNRKEIEEYAAGFDDATFAIDNIPRDVTIDINANPALTALRELKAAAEDTMDSMSGGGGGGLGGGGLGGGGLGGGLGDLGDLGGFDDMLPSFDEGYDSGEDVGDGFWKGLWDKIVTLNDDIGNFFKSLPGHISEFVKGAGTSIGDFFTGTVPDWLDNMKEDMTQWFRELPFKLGFFAGYASEQLWHFFSEKLPTALGKMFDRVKTWFQGLPNRIGTFVRDTGTRVWNFMSQTLPKWFSDRFTDFRKWASDLPGKIRTAATNAAKSIGRWLTNFGSALSTALRNVRNWFYNLPANLWNSIKNAASNIWNEFARGFQSGASASARGRKTGTMGGGYASGGYTGPGGKYEPAGVVHRGEYVIPKAMVNQRTGLPYADALGKLVRGTQPSGSYARGGYVTPAPGVSTVALTAGTIQAIAQATGKSIYLNGKLIADSSSESYSQDFTVGAY